MTPKPIRVLLVEDAPTDARLLQEALVEGDPTQFKVTHVPRLSEALLRLGEEACDVVLLDLDCRTVTGLIHSPSPGRRLPTYPLWC